MHKHYIFLISAGCSTLCDPWAYKHRNNGINMAICINRCINWGSPLKTTPEWIHLEIITRHLKFQLLHPDSLMLASCNIETKAAYFRVKHILLREQQTQRCITTWLFSWHYMQCDGESYGSAKFGSKRLHAHYRISPPQGTPFKEEHNISSSSSSLTLWIKSDPFKLENHWAYIC